MTAPASPVLTVAQAAAYLQVSRRTLEREVNDHKLAYVQVRGSKRFYPRDLDDYLERQRMAPLISLRDRRSIGGR